MYRYDDFDSTLVDAPGGPVSRPDAAIPARRADRGRVSPVAPARTASISRSMRRCFGSPFPTASFLRTQLRMLARISREYDRGYGHFTTRQNIQFNWPRLEDVPDILALLATVEMHAIQTSGNCVRNTTTDPFAGVAADEIVDPRPWAELVRQWSTMNPEFAFLPRKFKIAVTGATADRTAALRARHRRAGGARRAWRGRLPRLRRRRSGPHADDRARDPRVPAGRRAPQLFRRDPARLQPPRAARQQIQGADQDHREGNDSGGVHPPGRSRMGARARRPRHRARGEIARLAAFFIDPPYRDFARDSVAYRAAIADSRPFSRWAERNVQPAQAQGLRDRHAVAQAHRNAARRRDRRATGSDRGSGRALQLRRGPRHARAEPRARRRAAERSPRASGCA